MTSIRLEKWRLWCTTDSKYEYVWLEEGNVPTVCTSNTTHSIDILQNRIMEIRDPIEISIKEETTPTGGNYAIGSIAFDALPNQITSNVTVFPMSINVIDANIKTSLENKGDKMSWMVSPNTIVGSITSSVAIGDTVINVSPTIFLAIKIGFHMHLSDGIIIDDLHRVIFLDEEKGQVTVEHATTHAFSVTSPTYVMMSIVYVDNLEFGHPGAIAIAESKIGSSYLPANVELVSKYENKSLTDTKRFVVYVEYLY